MQGIISVNCLFKKQTYLYPFMIQLIKGTIEVIITPVEHTVERLRKFNLGRHLEILEI